MISVKGQKRLGHAKIYLLKEFNSKFATSNTAHYFHMGVPPGALYFVLNYLPSSPLLCHTVPPLLTLYVNFLVTKWFSFCIASGARVALNEVFGHPQQQQIRSTAPVADVISKARTLVKSLATSNRTGGGKLAFKGSSRTKAGKHGFPFKSSRATGLTKGKVAAPRVHQKTCCSFGSQGKLPRSVHPGRCHGSD